MAESHCSKAGAEKVLAIHLVVGDNSGIVPDSVLMYFDIVAEGGPCEGARLDFRHVQPKLRCPSCGELFVRKRGSFACPKCGTDGEPTDIGREFYVESMEVE